MPSLKIRFPVLRTKLLLQTTCKPLKVKSTDSIPIRDFDQEEKSKAIVLRYLQRWKFDSLLESKAVWFSRLGALQDEFEATLPLKPRAQLEERDYKIAKKFAAHPALSQQVLTMTDRNIDGGQKMFAVNCWFLGGLESEKMWEEYGENGKGIALRSSIERLSIAFPKMGPKIKKLTVIGKVQYVDFANYEMSETEAINIDRVAFLRPEERVHEREIRILIPNIQFNSDHYSIDFEQLEQKGLFIKCELPTLIETVIVGPNTDQHFFAAIERLVSKCGLHIPVIKSQLTNS